MKLVHREHPPIGTVVLFGHQLWLGWLMIAALAFSALIGFTLGTLKTPDRRAATQQGPACGSGHESRRVAVGGCSDRPASCSWRSASGGATPARRRSLSIEIVRDGWKNIRQVIGDMMDESPTKLGERELERCRFACAPKCASCPG
jgi:hypothetical protein